MSEAEGFMTKTGYERDFFAWLNAQAAHLRARDWDALDLDHVIEEIESLGNEQRHAVESHLRVPLLHLLKWTYQPQRRRRGWRSSVNNARAEIEARLRRSPSLRREMPEFLNWAYPKARRAAADETDLPLTTFSGPQGWSTSSPKRHG
jgi:hypothetical protein